ncbi:MAG: ATP-dependent Lhr-like helicase, partial [Myxococcota bacterium]
MSTLDAFAAPTRLWFSEAFAAPTRVQAEGWPHIQAGRNALLLAPTGSGKTLAAFLACLDRLSQLPLDAEPGVRLLYISPLKALVYDIERNLRAPLVGIGNAASRLGLPLRGMRVDLRTGDTPQRDRQRQIRNPGEILVTTPESLYLLLGGRARETLRTVDAVIVDEIHVMARSKRGVHLALSLERLSALTAVEPQRIGLSATQRPLDEVARFLGGDREVSIVDTSEAPNLDLQIVVPVADMENPVSDTIHQGTGGDGPLQKVGGKRKSGPILGDGAPKKSAGIWPTIYPRLVSLIRSHRTTIIFTNSRLLCERLAQRLNESAGEDLVQAHHGSISHVRRSVIEEQLKAGQIPCLVATSSLELGIDMGAVDLVVLVESPGSVARALQRVGRAGHGVGETSIGKIFPKYRGDLLECAVVAQHMREGRIEATHVPRNCLDVLAQQIVAMVAMQPWSVGELKAIIGRAYPYRDLSDAAFESVLDMVSGRYPSDDFADLKPRVVWDRTADELRTRKGAKMIALLNGGTIPDRGLYSVYAGAEGPRVGELDEEMVYECRKGDLIILGASTWRVEEITRDRVVVSPAPGEPGRLPFWHGDRPGRPVELGKAIGAFTRELVAAPSPVDWVREQAPLDTFAANNLVKYVQEQQEATGHVPTDRDLVLESFRDELGDWRVCLLTPFGARVHAPWALAIEALLATRGGFDVQALWTDDGIAIRFADIEELPGIEQFLVDPEEVEDLVVEHLRSSALFSSRFRENAGRALLLTRRSPKGRQPLWQQRMRAQNLLKVASRYESFPIVLETYRDCLQEVFDLPALKGILTDIRSRVLRVHEVETVTPSPFARGLVFKFVASFMYDGDTPLAERRAQALTLDRNLLRELLGQEHLSELLVPDAVSEVDDEVQWRTEAQRVRHADGLHDLLRRLGELSEAEIGERADEEVGPWIASLSLERRAIPVRVAGVERWIAVEDAGRYRDALGVVLPPGLPAVFTEAVPDALETLMLRYARTHGPFRAQAPAERFGLPVGAAAAVLRSLEARDLVLSGAIRPGGHSDEWCAPEVLRRLRRKSLAALRNEIAPVEAEVYARFLPEWHGLDSKRGGHPRLQEVVDQLEGLPLPWSALETEVLPARIVGWNPRLLDELGAMGAVVWIGRGALGPKDGKVALYRRERVPLLVDLPEVPEGLLDDPSDPDAPIRAALLTHLEGRGASFLVELQRVAGNPALADVERALWDLAWAGL